MYQPDRSVSRKDDSRRQPRSRVPLGKSTTLTTSPHAGRAHVVELSHKSEDSSGLSKNKSISVLKKSKPLTSSTNKGPDVGGLPRTVQGSGRDQTWESTLQRGLGRSPTPFPDENVNSESKHETPPIPSLDRNHMRARTTSGGSRNKTRSEERKLTFTQSANESSRPFLPPSHYASASDLSTSIGQRESLDSERTTQEEHGSACKRKPLSLFDSMKGSEVSKVSEEEVVCPPRPESRVSNSGKSRVLKRNNSWSKDKKREGEESPHLSRRASQMGLPELEKDLLPSLRDTVDRMTGYKRTSYEDSKTARSLRIVDSHNEQQRLSGFLCSPVHSVQSRSGTHQSETLTSDAFRDSRLQSPHSPNFTTSGNFGGYGSNKTNGPYERNVENTLLSPENSSPTVDEQIGYNVVNGLALSPRSLRRMPSNENSLKSKLVSRSLLRPPQTLGGKKSPDVSPDQSEANTQFLSALRTPRARSSSSNKHIEGSSFPQSVESQRQPLASRLSPEIASSQSPSLSRQNKVTLISRTSGPHLPLSRAASPLSLRSPTFKSPKSSSGPDLSRYRSKSSGQDDRNIGLLGSNEATPKLSSIAALRYGTASEVCVDGRPITDDLISRRSPSEMPSVQLSSRIDRSDALTGHSGKAPLGSHGLLASESVIHTSGTSEYETEPSDGLSEDSHARRRNELAALVEGLDIQTGGANTRESFSSYSDRSSVYAQGDYVTGDPVAYDQSEELDKDIEKVPSETIIKDIGHAIETGQYLSNLENGYSDAIASDSRNIRTRSQQPREQEIILNRHHLSVVKHPTLDTKSHMNTSLRRKQDWTSGDNRESLIMLNADRQREVFGIPRSTIDPEETGLLSQAESCSSVLKPSSDSDYEGTINADLGLSFGAERLFETLGIGLQVHLPSKRCAENSNPIERRASWRASIAEAEKYISEKIETASLSASSSSSSIYEDDVPDRPWQKRDRDFDRLQSSGGHNLKSSWRKTLSHSAYVALLDRYGDVEMRRQEAIWQLCETEQTFLKILRMTLKVFVQPLVGKNRTWVAGVPIQIMRLFDWLDDIFQLHTQINSALHHTRSSQYPVVLRVGEALRGFVPKLEVYQPYIVRLDDVVEDVEKMLKDPASELGEFFRIQSKTDACTGMTLTSLLWLPMSRLGQYLKYFKELWSLTPRLHVDHLAIFSLLHSTTTVVRVMREVKVREEEYTFTKDLVSRIRGLPKSFRLVSRDRRLVAHGALYRVHINERRRLELEGYTSVNPWNVRYNDATTSRSSPFNSRGPRRSFQQHRRAASFDYHSLSDFSNATSTSSLSSHAPDEIQDYQKDYRDMRRGNQNHNTVVKASSSRRAMNLTNSVDPHRTRCKFKMAPLYAFIFTDLALFTQPIGYKRRDSTRNEAWELLEDIGICRVLALTDCSDRFNFDHLIDLHILPMDIEQLDSGVPSDASATSLFLHLPRSKDIGSGSNARRQWWDALEQCYLFTLRSLSFPTYSNKYLIPTLETSREADSKRTVMSLLASGLPLPKSPSVQMEDMEKNRQNDVALREREERGWWALRFQQTLRDFQREDICSQSLLRATSQAISAGSRKVITGQRRLKLTETRKNPLHLR